MSVGRRADQHDNRPGDVPEHYFAAGLYALLKIVAHLAKYVCNRLLQAGRAAGAGRGAGVAVSRVDAKDVGDVWSVMHCHLGCRHVRGVEIPLQRKADQRGQSTMSGVCEH